jgi:LVIVD repeat
LTPARKQVDIKSTQLFIGIYLKRTGHHLRRYLQHKIAGLASAILLVNVITITTASGNIHTKYDYNYIQSAFAAPLITPSTSSSNNIVNTKSIYEITFTTATTGTIKTVRIIFPTGSTVTGTQLIEKSDSIGPGVISSSGSVVNYTLSSPVTIAAGTSIRLELANIVNTNAAGNTAISITTISTNGVVIDGPTNSVAYPIKQIGSADIANGAVTSAKVSEDNIYTAWEVGKNTLLRIHSRMGYDPAPQSVNSPSRFTAAGPAIAASGNNVYISWLNTSSIDPGSGEPSCRACHDIAFKKSSDGGGTFGNSISLANNNAAAVMTEIGLGDNATYAPAIAVSGNNVYVAWTAQNKEILLRKSIDGGTTFGNIIKLGINPGYSASPSLAVSGNNVYVAWQDVMQGNKEILLRKSIDGGTTFGSINNLSNNAADSIFPAIAVSGNNVYVAWQDVMQGNKEILLRKSIDGGTTFGSINNLSNNAADSIFPAIAVSGNNVYVVWSERTLGNDHILFRSSVDGGTTFRMVTTLSNNFGDYAIPAIAVSGNNVYIIWCVIWNDTHRTPYHYILFRSSVDGGTTFGITINLHNNTPNYAYPAIAVS